MSLCSKSCYICFKYNYAFFCYLWLYLLATSHFWSPWRYYMTLCKCYVFVYLSLSLSLLLWPFTFTKESGVDITLTPNLSLHLRKTRIITILVKPFLKRILGHFSRFFGVPDCLSLWKKWISHNYFAMSSTSYHFETWTFS